MFEKTKDALTPYLTLSQLRTNGWSVLRWTLAIGILVFTPIYLAYKPQAYTPLVETLLNGFLFLLAYWIGSTREVEEAARKANDRWLPQAESVILRLMTLRANVCRFSHTTKKSCASTTCELPELKEDAFRAVRIKINADCNAASQRLDDIAHQLEDAIEDWRRFIIANCHGEECSRIYDALQQRETKLWNELAQEFICVSETPSIASNNSGQASQDKDNS